jgi:hypothetical protein
MHTMFSFDFWLALPGEVVLPAAVLMESWFLLGFRPAISRFTVLKYVVGSFVAFRMASMCDIWWPKGSALESYVAAVFFFFFLFFFFFGGTTCSWVSDVQAGVCSGVWKSAAVGDGEGWAALSLGCKVSELAADPASDLRVKGELALILMLGTAGTVFFVFGAVDVIFDFTELPGETGVGADVTVVVRAD